MQPATLLPDSSLVRLDYCTEDAHSLIVVLSACRTEVACPDCQEPARRMHSRYARTLADQPWNGISTRFRLHTRRWFCDRPECSRRIFTERLPGLTRRYARRTDKQAQVLRLLAYVLGGEEGARTAQGLGFPVSPDTLLRQVRRPGTERGHAPRVLGVDDFAFLRGQRYGTLLVDLETNEPIDLLADRSAETLATWLREHPGAEIISRDRASSYAEGARQGAPNATQVADRWHLLKNLTEALGNVLAREQAALRAAAVPPEPDPKAAAPDNSLEAGADAASKTVPGTVPAMDPPESNPAATATEPPSEAVIGSWDRRSRRERERSEQSRARLLALYHEARRLHAEGLNVPKIARQLGIARATVGKYLAAETFPERKVRNSPPGSVEPYADYLRQRWEAGCHDAVQLWREIREQGYTGQRVAVWRYTRRWCAPTVRAEPGSKPMAKSPIPPKEDSVPANPAPRGVVWWLLCPKKRTPAQSEFVERLRAQSAPVSLAHDLVAEFFGLVRGRQAEGLEAWMRRAEASDLPDLVGFCHGVRRDWDAVVAGMSLEWSNGPVEGQVNRLKLIKRQMYGRAAFDLLRGRVLPRG